MVSSRDTLFAGELYESRAAPVDAVLNSLTSPGAAESVPSVHLLLTAFSSSEGNFGERTLSWGTYKSDLLTAALAMWSVMQCVAMTGFDVLRAAHYTCEGHTLADVDHGSAAPLANDYV